MTFRDTQSPVGEMITLHLTEGQRALEEAQQLVRQALEKIGFDPSASPSTMRTPERWLSYLLEFMQPFDLNDLMGSGFDAETNDTSIHGVIVQSNIPYNGVCEHHLLPYHGQAFIGYIPNGRVVGLSKMARLVHAIGHARPSLQEAQTEQIADVMFKHLDSKGSMVILRATHSCMSCRGINATGAITTTSCLRGLFRDVQPLREEFLAIAGLNR